MVKITPSKEKCLPSCLQRQHRKTSSIQVRLMKMTRKRGSRLSGGVAVEWMAAQNSTFYIYILAFLLKLFCMFDFPLFGGHFIPFQS